MKTDIKLFDIVKSLAGHDFGELFVVSKIVDEKYCLIIDGKNRTLNEPKLKKKKHLEIVSSAEKELADLFYDSSKINDAKIRKLLKSEKQKMGD